jgi:hypothetical protein
LLALQFADDRRRQFRIGGIEGIVEKTAFGLARSGKG